jgi:hypothetical protein
MKIKKMLAMMLMTALAASVLAPATAGANSKPKTVGTDEEGDWGSENATGEDISRIGHELGMDLTEAAIGMDGKDTVNFVIKVTNLPGFGGTPEVARYIWSLEIDGEYAELDGKFTNYSRGVCDPTSGKCPPPRNPGQQPFFVRGDCEVVEGANLTTCKELGIVQAAFDTAESTITIPVPTEMLNIKPGSKIAPGSSSFTDQAGGPVIAIPSAFFSRTDMPRDALRIDKVYTVPGGKKKKKK